MAGGDWNYSNNGAIEERLAPFRLGAVLLGIARVAALLRTWQNKPDFTTDQGFAKRYLPTYYAGIKRVYEGGKNHVTFTRLNLLFVAKQACRVCALNGKDIGNDEDVETVLSCCLLASDLMLERYPAPNDTTVDKAASLLPFANYIPRDSYTTDLARNLLLIEEIAPQLSGRADYIDIGALFAKATGITARRFCEFAFIAAVKFITNVETQMDDPATAFLLTPQYFQHTAVPQRDIITFLSRLSTTIETLRTDGKRDSLYADFLAFQRHPLIEHTTGTYICPDVGFLLDKAGPSLYWTLHDAANRRTDLLTYWCTVIERYAQWLFDATYQGHGEYLSAPQFSGGGEACDLCLVEGSALVMFEVKGSILTVNSKYGFSAETLHSELRRKAIVGEDGERKGVAQLSHNLRRFLSGDDIEGVDRSAIRTIYPVLVFLDHGFTAPYLNVIYNKAFDSPGLRREYRRRITPLFSLTIEDLENVLPYTCQYLFTDILYSYNRANRNMYGELSHSSIPILPGQAPGQDPVRERFDKFADDLQREIFPQPRPSGSGG